MLSRPALKQAVVVALVLGTLTVVSSGGNAIATTACSQSAGPVRSAPGAGKTVALTFDDGPTKFTSQVLRILRRNNVRATFFVTGRSAAARTGAVGSGGGGGHLIAGHTYDHRYPQETADGWTRGYIDDQLVAPTGCSPKPPAGRCASSGPRVATQAPGCTTRCGRDAWPW